MCHLNGESHRRLLVDRYVQPNSRLTGGIAASAHAAFANRVTVNVRGRGVNTPQRAVQYRPSKPWALGQVSPRSGDLVRAHGRSPGAQLLRAVTSYFGK